MSLLRVIFVASFYLYTAYVHCWALFCLLQFQRAPVGGTLFGVNDCEKLVDCGL